MYKNVHFHCIRKQIHIVLPALSLKKKIELQHKLNTTEIMYNSWKVSKVKQKHHHFVQKCIIDDTNIFIIKLID